MSGVDKAFGWFLLTLCVLLATIPEGPWYAQMAVACVAVGMAFLLGQERGETRS